MSATLTVAVVMDPIATITPYKDSSLAMLLAAQTRGWRLLYLEQRDLAIRDGVCVAQARELQVRDDNDDWFSLGEPSSIDLGQVDIVLMRKDPPFDSEFIYSTYMLERAETAGALVCNKPASLRDVNEKAFISWFADCCPPTLISRDMAQIKAFVQEQGDAILKPLDGMGGRSIFRASATDPNLSVILETLTDHDQVTAMAQRYIPEVTNGDKRILMIDGEPVPYCLARLPAKGETRANLAAGGTGEVRELTERDRWLAAQIGPTLKAKGLYFVGLDVIGDYVTEINVTSPTCIREIEAATGLDIAGQLLEVLAAKRGE